MILTSSDSENGCFSRDAHFKLDDFERVSEEYCRALGTAGGKPPTRHFCRYGQAIRMHGGVQTAAGVWVQACKQHPHAGSAYHDAGVAMMLLNDTHQAEDALAQANATDCINPDV